MRIFNGGRKYNKTREAITERGKQQSFLTLQNMKQIMARLARKPGGEESCGEWRVTIRRKKR